MKTKQIIKEKSLLIELRTIRDKMNEEMKGLTSEQIVKFLRNKKTLHPKSVWGKPI